jgi:Zn-dependent peptidase ImmA (M78 family)
MILNLDMVANETRSRRLADEIVRFYGITTPDDIRLKDIAMDRKVFVREGPLNGSEAYLIRKGDRGIIKVRENIPELGRKRFAIAHELGHWELHYEDSQLIYCTDEDINNYKGSRMEIEANAFASELLMPTRIVSPEFRNMTPSIGSIKYLSDKFNVSLTAAAVKFVQICKENCLVVFSKNGIVHWFKKGRDESFIPGIQKNHPLHIESEANEIYSGNKSSGIMVRVPVEAWFPFLHRKNELEVYEESINLGNYPVILTLLWVISE